jgi:hypothetical protein
MSSLRVFVSHCSANKAAVKAVLDRLVGPTSLIETWYDEKPLVSAAAPLEFQIRQAILENTDFVIAFFSAAALQSEWFKTEINTALDRERRDQRTVVLPVLLDPDLRRQDCGKPWADRFMAVCLTQSESDLDHLANEIEKCLFAMTLDWIRTLTQPRVAEKSPALSRKRMEMSPAEWREIFSMARERIWLIGHSMAKVVDPKYSGEVISERLSMGVDVRLIVLDPFDPSGQLLEVSRQLNQVDLEAKIRNTLRDARGLEDTAHQNWQAQSIEQRQQAALAPKVRVGLTQSTIHSSIVIVDDRFLVTPYSHMDEMGDQGLLLDLSAADSQHSALCSSFEQDFRWHWEQSRPCFGWTQPAPRVESRILTHSKSASESVSWFLGTHATPPLPHIAVILPTYRCLHGSRIRLSAPGEYLPQGEFDYLLCPNCMYGPELNQRNRQDMPLEAFAALVDELIGLAIPIVELSGGGEPLHHPAGRELVDVLYAAGRRTDGTQFGLLSNIHSLGTCDFVDAIARTFAYTRWSWPEDAESQPSLRNDYMSSLQELIAQRGKPAEAETGLLPRLGVKVLATKRNVRHGERGELPIVELVQDLFEVGVDHVKVRILRSMSSSPDPESLRIAEDDLYRLLLRLRRKGLLRDGRTLEVDLKDRTVAREYACKLSTLISVVDPNGDMRMCWNDVDDAERVIGNAVRDGFRQVWVSGHHIEVCRSMNPGNVCNLLHGCHCRIIGYQEFMEPLSGILEAQEAGIQFGDNFL